ncbi:MAG: chromosomal replication initiator protein DnaA [Candidatus Pacebacteria bacterium]|nr:chromosomal replication initiator protein DnaA [Candidatus Paceibacterota bacterium]
MDVKQIWSSVLNEIELAFSKINFNMWFKDTGVQRIDEEGGVYVSVPSVFVRDWIAEKHHKTMLSLFRKYSDNLVRSVHYVVIANNQKNQNLESPQANTHKIQNITRELPLTDFYINPDDNLNPRYTFESFVVGPFNELAHAAAQAIIKKPVAYNPLFFYGSTGLGKTHLMQAVGNYLKNHNKDRRVFYVTSEKFSTDYVSSMQANKINQFKEKYRKYDLLIMDDIQFLSNKEKTQDELFHLFNHMYENNRQIIFSSDVHPNYLQNLEDRLKSRFMAGMMVDISPADLESKTAILQAKARQNGVEIPLEIIQYIASTVEGSIRELEGALNALICHMQMKGNDISLSDIKMLTKNSTKPVRNVSVKEVIKAVASFYNIEEDSIYNKTRRQEVVKPRQLTMYILREDFNISYPLIGQKMGGRDHTTVIHSCDKIKNEIKNNPLLIQELNQIRALI